MAYIPPHKRHSKDKEGSSRSPKPELPPPPPHLFNKNLKLKSSRTNRQKTFAEKIYAEEAISRWFPVGLDDHNQFPASVHLQPVSLESLEQETGEKHLALMNSDLPEQSSSRVTESFSRSPWGYIAENVLQDLLSSFECLRSEMESQNLVEVRPTIIARFGKVLFPERPSVNRESFTTNLASENTLKQLKRSFYTSIPDSYVEYMLKEGAPKSRLEFEEEKEVYRVFFSDATRPDSTISCKCRVLKEHGKLQIYKIELHCMRHMVMDISCLEKNLDLRLMLCAKRIMTSLTDDEMQSIRDLINSAIVDKEVKGGLRWPPGTPVSRDKFRVVVFWHTISKTYKNPSLRLKIRDAYRFKFWLSTGEAAREVVIKLKKVASELLRQQVDSNLIKEMLKDDLKLLWNNYFCCESFPT